jgi:hypothetical protein
MKIGLPKSGIVIKFDNKLLPMNSLFESNSAAGIIYRLAKLHPNTKSLWGKMNVSQMLAHCQVPLQAALGEKQFKRTFFGFVFGRIGKKRFMKEGPFKRNLPTDPRFVVRDDRDFDKEKKQLQVLIHRFATADPPTIAKKRHPFFGNMTQEEWGKLQWKHLDHHLRQFGV